MLLIDQLYPLHQDLPRVVVQAASALDHCTLEHWLIDHDWINLSANLRSNTAMQYAQLWWLKIRTLPLDCTDTDVTATLDYYRLVGLINPSTSTDQCLEFVKSIYNPRNPTVVRACHLAATLYDINITSSRYPLLEIELLMRASVGNTRSSDSHDVSMVNSIKSMTGIDRLKGWTAYDSNLALGYSRAPEWYHLSTRYQREFSELYTLEQLQGLARYVQCELYGALETTASLRLSLDECNQAALQPGRHPLVPTTTITLEPVDSCVGKECVHYRTVGDSSLDHIYVYTFEECSLLFQHAGYLISLSGQRHCTLTVGQFNSLIHWTRQSSSPSALDLHSLLIKLSTERVQSLVITPRTLEMERMSSLQRNQLCTLLNTVLDLGWLFRGYHASCTTPEEQLLTLHGHRCCALPVRSEQTQSEPSAFPRLERLVAAGAKRYLNALISGPVTELYARLLTLQATNLGTSTWSVELAVDRTRLVDRLNLALEPRSAHEVGSCIRLTSNAVVLSAAYYLQQLLGQPQPFQLDQLDLIG